REGLEHFYELLQLCALGARRAALAPDSICKSGQGFCQRLHHPVIAHEGKERRGAVRRRCRAGGGQLAEAPLRLSRRAFAGDGLMAIGWLAAGRWSSVLY